MALEGREENNGKARAEDGDGEMGRGMYKEGSMESMRVLGCPGMAQRMLL